MRLNPVAFGVACGVTLGVIGFFMTVFSLMWGAGNTVSVLAGVYLGYSWSFVGALVAVFWGLVDGFILGWLLATVYNLFVARGSSGSPHVA